MKDSWETDALARIEAMCRHILPIVLASSRELQVREEDVKEAQKLIDGILDSDGHGRRRTGGMPKRTGAAPGGTSSDFGEN